MCASWDGSATHAGCQPPPFFPAEASIEELDSIDEVVPGKLWLTNFRSASDVKKLKKLRITHVVAVGTEFEADSLPGIKHWKRNIYDDNSEAHTMGCALRDGADFIDAAIKDGGRVLVHCAAGISRSSTIVLAYAMLHCDMKLRDAFRDLINCRRIIWPNDGFMAQLIALERELHGGAATISADVYNSWGDYDGPAVEIEGASPSPLNAVRDCKPRLQRMSTQVDVDTRRSHVSSVSILESAHQLAQSEASEHDAVAEGHAGFLRRQISRAGEESSHSVGSEKSISKADRKVSIAACACPKASRVSRPKCILPHAHTMRTRFSPPSVAASSVADDPRCA